MKSHSSYGLCADTTGGSHYFKHVIALYNAGFYADDGYASSLVDFTYNLSKFINYYVM